MKRFIEWFKRVILRRKKQLDMNDRYLKILALLENKGIDIETDLSDFMLSLFTNQPDLPPNQLYNGVEQDIIRMLDVMHENKHITYAKQTIRIEDDENRIKSRLEVLVRLTFGGLQYLNQHRLTASNINLNSSIKRNIKYQLSIGIITLLAIAGTTIYSIATYYKGDSDTLKATYKLLQQRAPLLDSIQQLQKERNKYLRTMAMKNDTLKVKVLSSK